MLSVEQFDDQGGLTGESCELVLKGDGPFKISQKCFIDKPEPPGPGFLPCPECATQIVDAEEIVTIAISPSLWVGKEGHIVIDISNSLGETVELKIMVNQLAIALQMKQQPAPPSELGA